MTTMPRINPRLGPEDEDDFCFAGAAASEGESACPANVAVTACEV
jgi:hypothetical protein